MLVSSHVILETVCRYSNAGFIALSNSCNAANQPFKPNPCTKSCVQCVLCHLMLFDTHTRAHTHTHTCVHTCSNVQAGRPPHLATVVYQDATLLLLLGHLIRRLPVGQTHTHAHTCAHTLLLLLGLFLACMGSFFSLRGFFFSLRGAFLACVGLFLACAGLFFSLRGLFFSLCGVVF